MGFTPLDPVNISVGQMAVNLYPKTTPLMPMHKRAHAFKVNTSALKDLQTNLWLVINAFGAQFNASLTVDGIMSNWCQYFHELWMDFARLTIISFHNSRGNRIDDTTVAGNAQVPLPIQDGTLPTCHKQDVHFMRVHCTLDFATLITVNPYPVGSVLQVVYYIELSQVSRAMVNGIGAVYTLVSFLGLDDLRTLAPNVETRTTLSPVFHGGPVTSCVRLFSINSALVSIQTNPKLCWSTPINCISMVAETLFVPLSLHTFNK